MIDKLNIIKQRFNELSDLIIQPDIISDQKKYVKINKEYKDIKNIMKLSFNGISRVSIEMTGSMQ